ncbi:lipid-binding protein [Mucilaginibacter terrenus]|uniref:Lipid-binding protein n=1 Tax=Mucilaginibacter terrenus TaxID=2482727 RepID=A0A3E2NQJ0_9SPHI|nr:START domain-containing protein [Mucilaginibacter terrenus]RFZ83262.1 lipid-binding protein [Mucilaginibacter terrenus]
MYKYLLGLLLLFLANNVSAQYNWTLKSDKDGVKVYTSLVTGSKIKAVKVECDVNARASQLVRVLLDVKHCPEWVYKTKSCSLVKQVSPSELYYYSEINVPWPATNRDFVAHLTVSQNPDTKVVTVDGPAVPGMVPVKDDAVRISSSKGLWVITPLDKSKVHINYTLQVDPGGNIPAWLINLFAAEGPMRSFEGLKAQLKKTEKEEGVAFIKD